MSKARADVSGKKALFPYLDFSGLDENDRIDLEDRLVTETMEIKIYFSKFLLQVIKSLGQSSTPLDMFKISILSLEAFTDNIGVKVLDKEDQLKIEAAKTISEVFVTLCKYISFINYHIIEHIIDQHGTARDRSLLDKYLTKFREFCKRSIFEVPLSTPNTRKTAKVFALKCTDVVATMEGVLRLKGRIAKCFGLRSSALHLYTFKKGCVELHFLISVAVFEHILPVSSSQHSALSEIGVKVLISTGMDQTNKEEIK